MICGRQCMLRVTLNGRMTSVQTIPTWTLVFPRTLGPISKAEHLAVRVNTRITESRHFAHNTAL